MPPVLRVAVLRKRNQRRFITGGSRTAPTRNKRGSPLVRGRVSLDQPKGELILEPASKKPPIDIFFGSENPTKTAVYARIGNDPKIFLLGANLQYYQTLMFQWVEGKQGKNA